MNKLKHLVSLKMIFLSKDDLIHSEAVNTLGVELRNLLFKNEM